MNPLAKLQPLFAEFMGMKITHLSKERVEAELLDRQHMDANGEGGVMATQALSAEQLAQLRAQLPQGQSLPGISGASAGRQGSRF